jgi:hypothetical protein
MVQLFLQSGPGSDYLLIKKKHKILLYNIAAMMLNIRIHKTLIYGLDTEENNQNSQGITLNLICAGQ